MKKGLSPNHHRRHLMNGGTTTTTTTDEETSLLLVVPLTEPCVIMKQVTGFEDGSEQVNFMCELQQQVPHGRLLDVLPIVRLDSIHKLLKSNEHQIITGYTTLWIENTEIGLQTRSLIIPLGSTLVYGKSNVDEVNPLPSRRRRGRRKQRRLNPISMNEDEDDEPDIRSVLVIRVTFTNSEGIVVAPIATKEVLSNKVFGTDGSDQANLKERFNSCSYGQLQMEPFEGMTHGGTNVTGGVIDIVVPEIYNDQWDALFAAYNTATYDYVGDMYNQFDHVMFSMKDMYTGPGAVAYGKQQKKFHGICLEKSKVNPFSLSE